MIVKVAVPSDSPTVWLAIVISGSSSKITKSAVLLPSGIITFDDGFDKVMVAVSVVSSVVSVLVGTVKVFDVCPAAIVNVPRVFV